MQPLAGLTVVTLEHAIAATLRHPPARRPRRPRHQGRAPRLGRLRPRLRRPRARPGLALRLDQPLQGERDPRRQAPRGAKALERLVLDKADVVVQNLAPGAAARLGLGYDRLATMKPEIIVCDISGYGADGPYRDKKAYDLLIQSEAGFLSVTGTPDEPSKAGPSIADIAAGMYAYTNILAALIQRGQTGRGPAHRRVDAGVADRMDVLPALLRLRRRAAAAAHRRRARHHLPVRPVPHRRRRHGDDGPAERARVGQLLPARAAASRSWPPTRGSPATPAGWPSGTRCGSSSSTPSPR